MEARKRKEGRRIFVRLNKGNIDRYYSLSFRELFYMCDITNRHTALLAL